jgi:hypothetical protein
MNFKTKRRKYKNIEPQVQSFKPEFTGISKSLIRQVGAESLCNAVTINKPQNFKQEIIAIKNNVINLSCNLGKSLDTCLQQSEINAAGFGAYVKLIDIVHKLINTEISLEDNTQQKQVNASEEDKIMLEQFIRDMAPRAGFEPATKRLTAACSTTELPRNLIEENFIPDNLQ